VNRKHVSSTELTSSCYYRQAAAILSRIAAIKGLADDAARYAKLADAIKTAIHAKFYKGNGVYDNARQTAQAFPLAFGVVPESERAAVAAKLVESVEKEGCHVDIGLLGSKHVFRALSRIGRTDLAFKMLTNPTKPSPVEWIQKGGTTLWEDWGDGASRNHIMFGDFMAWAYQYLAGIRLPEAEGSTSAVRLVPVRGFKEFVVEPAFIGELDCVSASVDGPYGKISSS
jgi:alpha-L-rhamnosidase